eukprot:2786567-Lingulodinium_polyedra.AAC.1
MGVQIHLRCANVRNTASTLARVLALLPGDVLLCHLVCNCFKEAAEWASPLALLRAPTNRRSCTTPVA